MSKMRMHVQSIWGCPKLSISLWLESCFRLAIAECRSINWAQVTLMWEGDLQDSSSMPSAALLSVPCQQTPALLLQCAPGQHPTTSTNISLPECFVVVVWLLKPFCLCKQDRNAVERMPVSLMTDGSWCINIPAQGDSP